MTDDRNIELRKSGPLKGEIIPPPDKSISHRSMIFASVADGVSRIRNLLRAADTISTMNAMRALGIDIDDKGEEIMVAGKGLYGLKEPEDVIDCGNSGTTMRLLTGLLSGHPFLSVLTGDDSLRKRPMSRVISPMKDMGAEIHARGGDSFAPIVITGGGLRGMDYTSPVASAQVKSAILLAGLYVEGETTVREPHKSRDHTERMLTAIGADLSVEGLRVTIRGGARLGPMDISVPGDFSSAAFFMAAASMVGGSEVLIRNVGVNPTRTGLIDIMKRMGAGLKILNERDVSGEPVADILCSYTGLLNAVETGPEEVPAMIDEFPILAVLATQAHGTTRIRGARELRVKESDRIAVMTEELRKLGVEVKEYPDGMDINGPVRMKGAVVKSHGDHRVAMSLSIAALAAEGVTTIKGVSAVDISFPGFYRTLGELSQSL
ncbi:3-phosphoshikimate 1-carboxyvinyltransferase 1 [bacterium BMS3Bbin06]|nr:3-phosphoshikimate 1-carboxyvinyltransferase 1 [bacterium BMS3Abin08]GBE35439.1 3-phosphoshikimate 1-carboxyvinyltransferase 1 [bacterium BMS3Bbin06]HDO35209.1 3-phosphoshikimate 1-carboxyvinyltransferase [Nitrospirota bacterium]HDY71444.1 3-phosphoshikimate 1-carboxyvinyltransferase [Nitrospirota bacterium]